MAQAPLSIGELSRRSGIAVSALRFYETHGLIASVRSAGNQRRYHRETLRRLAVIQVAQRVGIPLRSIAAALDALPASRTPTRADWMRLSSAWHDELTERITQLQQLRDALGGCIGCGCLSLRKCRLYNRDDVLAAQGPGPRRINSST